MPQSESGERRSCERLKLRAMYTRIAVAGDEPGGELNGHAYDISQSGVRIELDHALAVGAPVDVRLGLCGAEDDIRASAEVVWISDAEDDPGPRRMALRFRDFHTPDDSRRLGELVSRGLRSAA